MKMHIRRSMFMYEVVDSHDCRNNHLLLGHVKVRHLKKNSSFHLPYTKGLLNYGVWGTATVKKLGKR